MAHNLAEIGGKHAIVLHEKHGWHRLGTVFQEKLSVKEALEAASMAYQVDLYPNLTIARDVLDEANAAIVAGEFERGAKLLHARLIEVPGKNTTVRNGYGEEVPLGVVGERYNIVQNYDAFSFLEPAIDAGLATIDTIGALGRGEVVWMMVKSPDNVTEIGPGDAVEDYMLIRTSHDGSTSIENYLTRTRVVCQNTLDFAISGAKNRMKIRHTSSADDKLKLFKELVEQQQNYREIQNAIFKDWRSSTFTDADMKALGEKLFPGKKDPEGKVKVSAQAEAKRERLQELWAGDAPGSWDLGTKWQAFNAATYLLEHERSTRTDSWERAAFSGAAAKERQELFVYLSAN